MLSLKNYKQLNLRKKKGIKNNENINEPIEPKIVLLGLILVSFFPLKVLPTISPPISDNIATKIVYSK